MDGLILSREFRVVSKFEWRDYITEENIMFMIFLRSGLGLSSKNKQTKSSSKKLFMQYKEMFGTLIL